MAKYIIDDGQCQYRYNEGTKELKFPCPRLYRNNIMGLDITISDITISGVTPYTEPDREAIEDEVWEFVRMFSCLGNCAISEIGDDKNTTDPLGLIEKYSYQEVRTRYEAWKQEKEEIHIGDEVVYHGNKYVVGYVGADEVYHIVDRNWMRLVIQGEYQIFKTGRHFDEMEKLLERIRE